MSRHVQSRPLPEQDAASLRDKLRQQLAAKRDAFEDAKKNEARLNNKLQRAHVALKRAYNDWSSAGCPQAQPDALAAARKDLNRVRSAFYAHRAATAKAALCIGYFHVASVARMLATKYLLSRFLAIFSVAALAFALIVLVAIPSSTSPQNVFLVATVASACVALVLACLFFAPSDQRLLRCLAEVPAERADQRSKASIIESQLVHYLAVFRRLEHLERLARVHQEARDFLSRCWDEAEQACKTLALRSKEYEEAEKSYNSRTWLLSANWRSMTGVAFERFLRDVLIELGYDVEMTKASGDQGVDLIAEKGSARIAIQAKGYTEASVGNSAVQEVFAGKTHYRCNRCAVITNSRFTANARQLAQSTGCDLIDGGQIEELIAGNIL